MEGFLTLCWMFNLDMEFYNNELIETYEKPASCQSKWFGNKKVYNLANVTNG